MRHNATRFELVDMLYFLYLNSEKQTVLNIRNRLPSDSGELRISGHGQIGEIIALLFWREHIDRHEPLPVNKAKLALLKLIREDGGLEQT